MFYKFCYVFIGFGFLFISIRIFANKKFERFAIEHDFSSLGDTYVIPAIMSLAASFASTSTAVIALPKWDIG